MPSAPTIDRAWIHKELSNRSWFRASPQEVQESLRALPERWNRALQELLRRPIRIGNLTMLAIDELLVPESAYSATLVVRVGRPDGTSESRSSFTWYRGRKSGGKGVVLVRGTGGSVTHILFLKGVSIPAWTVRYDCPGGGTENEETQEETFRRETIEEFGLVEEATAGTFQFSEVRWLGLSHPDQSLTGMEVDLFAGYIDQATFEKLIVPRLQQQHRDKLIGDLDKKPNIACCRVSELRGPGGMIVKNTDGYFRSCIALLGALDLIPHHS